MYKSKKINEIMMHEMTENREREEQRRKEEEALAR